MALKYWAMAMKYLTIIAVIALFATEVIPAHAQVRSEGPPSQSQQRPSLPPPSSVAPITNNQTTTYHQQESKDKPEGWRKFVTWPDGITAWLILLTLVAITWQSVATAKAAKAALLQANHMVTSERAWMIAEAGDPGIPPEVEGATGVRWTEFSLRFVNKGKTPAFLLEAGYCGKVLPHGETLPTIQPPYGEKEVYKWDGKGLPLLPGGEVSKSHLGTWAKDPVKITHGFDVLWVYGYIKYGDAFGFVRETWYCYRWVHEIERYQASGFVAGGPESYNHAT